MPTSMMGKPVRAESPIRADWAIHVRVGEDDRRAWVSHGDTSVRGYAFQGGEYLEGGNLAARFQAAATPTRSTSAGSGSVHPPCAVPSLPELLRNLNGSFAVVRCVGQCLEAAVDRVRGVPLFYALLGGEFFLSDDAGWVRQCVADDVTDDVAEAEFQMTGYVTGPDTLCPRVKQLRAGEYLLVVVGSEGPTVRLSRYAEFSHDLAAGDRVANTLRDEFDGVLVRVFERLLRSLNGRPVTVPLSGGYDSRVVVLMLKRLGYRDVTCFSYGREGNRESRISGRLARQLGFRWEFVPYTAQRWYNWFREPARAEYYAFADGLCSIPHLQDWPAVWELKDRGVIAPGTVFVPGHTGDFISGGHIPREIGTSQRMDVETLARLIEDKHYVLNGAEVVGAAWASRVREKLRATLDGAEISTAEEAADAFERWEWQERQAKFICNAVRVYEFWGYDWRLPLWDAEVMAFWERVPLRLRLGKRLYDGYVRALGRNRRVPSRIAEPWAVTAARWSVEAVGMTKTVGRALRSVNAWYAGRAYSQHSMGWFGVMFEDVFRRHYTGREHLNSFLTRERLGRLVL